MEEWRPIPDHPGYEASSLGGIRSLDRWVTYRNGIKRFYPSAMLHPVRCRRYFIVNLGRARCKRWHVIICMAFHGPQPSQSHQVAHWNGDTADNRAANLRWTTPRENMADQSRHGTRLLGVRHWKAKLSETDVRTIRSMRASGTFLSAISRRFGISISHVHRIVGKDSWRHLP